MPSCSTFTAWDRGTIHLISRFRTWKFPAAKLEAHLAAGGTKADFKCKIRKSLLDRMVMPSNSLLYFIDPKGTKKVMDVARRLEPYVRDFALFCDQHLEENKVIVDSWPLEQYLSVMESFHLITRIRNKDESWGELKFKCNCKGCHVRGCCRDNLLWSMVLNPAGHPSQVCRARAGLT